MLLPLEYGFSVPWPPRPPGPPNIVTTLGQEFDAGRLRGSSFDFTPLTAYPSGGYGISPTAFGMNSIFFVDFEPVNISSAIYNFVWDTTLKTVRVFVTSTGTELLTGNANLMNSTIRIFILGE